jgi:hypothetical protein
MPNDKHLLHATELRARAQEVLAQAKTTSDAGAQQNMRLIAAAEKLAERLELHAGGADKGVALAPSPSRRPWRVRGAGHPK